MNQLLALELDSIELPGCRRADVGLREDGRRRRDGGSEAGKEGGSETARTKKEAKERGREAGRRYLPEVRRRVWNVYVNTAVRLGEASRDARLLADSKTISV